MKDTCIAAVKEASDFNALSIIIYNCMHKDNMHVHAE